MTFKLDLQLQYLLREASGTSFARIVNNELIKIFFFYFLSEICQLEIDFRDFRKQIIIYSFWLFASTFQWIICQKNCCTQIQDGWNLL